MLDGSPLKTDAKDARVIADLMRQGKSRPISTQEGLYQELRYLAEVRHRLMIERTSLLNRLNRLLDLLFPELPGLFKALDGVTIRTLLKVAPTPTEVLELGVEGLTDLLVKASHGKLGRQRAEAIIAAAHTSVGCQYGADVLRFELQLLLPRVEEILAQRDQVDERMTTAIAGIDYASKLLSIPGIGPVTVAVFLGEVGDLRNYRNAKQVLKMAGLNLFERSSGTHKGMRRMTKRGRPELRRILYLAAIRMVVKGMPLKGLYQKMTPNKPTPKVIVAGMRRLVKAMFAMVRDDRPFVQEQFEVRPTMTVGLQLAA
jgi:transposase